MTNKKMESPASPKSYLEKLPDEMLLNIMEYLNLSDKTRTRRVSTRFKDFNPSREELNSIRRKLNILGLLLLTGSNFFDLKISDEVLKIQAKDKSHTSTIILKKNKNNEIIYETLGDYEDEIDKSLLYGSEDISIEYFLNLIATLVELYPNGSISINKNKIDLHYDPVALGVILAQEKFSELDINDNVIDNFLYNYYVFEEFQKLMKDIPKDVIPILNQII